MAIDFTIRRKAGQFIEADDLTTLIDNADENLTASSFSGSRVSGSQVYVTAAAELFSFGTEDFDVGGWFAPGSPTFFEVPTGITIAQFACTWQWSALPTDPIIELTDSSGVSMPGQWRVALDRQKYATAVSAYITVVATDRFAFRAVHSSGSDRTLVAEFTVRGWR